MLIDHARRLWSRTGWARLGEKRRNYIADTAFARFTPWSGVAPAGYDVNFLGQITDLRFVAGMLGTMDGDPRMQERSGISTSYPPLTEETFEWLILLDAVLEARDRFVMVELGAGFGRWLVAAALALQDAHPSMRCHLVGVEGDAQHYEWLRQHFRENGLDPDAHRLIHGAISDRDEEGRFAVNDDPSGWWGQWLMRPETPLAGAPNLRTELIRTYSIETLLGGLDRVDHMDFDIQGAEGHVIAAGINVMTAKVRRVFVETHWPDIHESVANCFRSCGWRCTYRYGFINGANVSEDRTPFGPVTFQGGLQCWVNTALR